MKRPMVVAAIAVLLVSACGAANRGGGSGESLHMMRVKGYSNVADLRADSDAVARFRATNDQRVFEIANFPITVTRMEVIDVLHGSLTGSSFHLRQYGSTAVDLDEALPIVTPGTEYVGFLLRETFPSDSPKVQYWPTGATGLFEVDAGELVDLDPASGLPETDTVDELMDLALQDPPANRTPLPRPPTSLPSTQQLPTG